VWFSLVTYRSDIFGAAGSLRYVKNCLAIRLEQIFERKIEDLNKLDEKYPGKITMDGEKYTSEVLCTY
jgi:hypothetical protein